MLCIRLKNDVLLDHDLYQNGNELTLTDLSPANSGRYQCRANSLAGAVMSSAATLTVKGKFLRRWKKFSLFEYKYL